ncbi:MAG: sigma-54 dependent transcriptional regulator [Holosporaceae bacterium]|jgi:two-component system response regulator FlrC|nr:sigma-54 dependent transcriptional regulator [Holosporaceae bacterium]
MRVIAIGEKLEHSLFEIVNASRALGCNTLFFKKEIKSAPNSEDVIIADGDAVKMLPPDTKNLVISVAYSPGYETSLENEVSIGPRSLGSVGDIIRNKMCSGFNPIAADPATKEVFRVADRIADSDATVLITGETGTGKEVMAEYIRRRSKRFLRNYVAVNCAAIPETLLESELFGHEKGAFTNAIRQRIGKFEEANHGTLLLDEISEIPLGLQSKLLRAIQKKEITRLGGNGTTHTDVRIIATSNRDLQQEVSNGNFREDLFYRINIVSVEMPRLNDRPEDIEPLARFFCEKYSGGTKTLSDAFVFFLKNRCWKGNIRELENFVHRSVLLSSDNVIDCSAADCERRPKTLRQLERETILNSIKKFQGNKTLASKELGISLRALHYKLEAYKAG